MVIKKPLVLGSDDIFAEELSSNDTLSTENITDYVNKRFVTDAEKLAIGAVSNPTCIIQDTQPEVSSSCLWVQTNYNGDPEALTFWIITP